MKRVILISVLCALTALLTAGVTAHRNPDASQEDFLLLIEEAESPKVTKTNTSWKGTVPAQTDESEKVRLLDRGSVLTLDEEEYLAEVLLSEMPADFQTEAMKAQVVAARTFLHKKEESGKHGDADVCSSSSCCQAWTDKDGLKEKLGDAYERDFQKALDAVRATRDEVLVYQGALIDATFFSCSGGSTESAAAVWGGEVPYLQSMPSPGEENALPYKSSVTFQPEDLKKCLAADGKSPNFSGDPEGWIGDIQYTQGGGVSEMKIGGVSFSGVELRRLLHLNSTKFTVSVDGAGFSFEVLGYGHRVGMSQYGANEMAKNGFSYSTILTYYYQGVKIKSLSQISLGQANNP